MRPELRRDNTSIPHATLTSSCPGCGLSILFDPAELSARDDPGARDVMCAWCGTVTSKRLLAREVTGQ
jgi:hypothetical protein